MIDKVKVEVEYLPPDIFFSQDNAGTVQYLDLIYRPMYDRNKFLKYYMAELGNLRIFIHRSWAVLANSIHKYYKGNNTADFVLWEIQDCISTVSMLTGIDWGKGVPSLLEYGVNLQGVDSMRIIHSMDSYKDKQFFPLTKNGTVYGKDCEFERYYTLKAYDKEYEAWKTAGLRTPGNVFRWEVVAAERHLKRILGGAIPTLNELFDPKNDYLKMLSTDCLEKFNNSIRLSNGFNLSALTLGEKKIISYMANPTLKEDIRVNHPDQYKKDRLKYLKLIASGEHQVGENISGIIEEKINYLTGLMPACSILDIGGNILPGSIKGDNTKLLNKESTIDHYKSIQIINMEKKIAKIRSTKVKRELKPPAEQIDTIIPPQSPINAEGLRAALLAKLKSPI